MSTLSKFLCYRLLQLTETMYYKGGLFSYDATVADFTLFKKELKMFSLFKSSQAVLVLIAANLNILVDVFHTI